MTYRTNRGPWNPVGEKLTGYGKHRTDFRKLSEYLARQADWHMGSMWATSNIKAYSRYGKLSGAYYESVTHADYIVWSYETPIAWLTYGIWYMPEKRYSPTTTQHQGKIRTALSVME